MADCKNCKYNVPYDFDLAEIINNSFEIMNSYDDIHELCLQGKCILCMANKDCELFERNGGRDMLTREQKQDVLNELEISEMFLKDLEKLWKSYAKKALVAKQERELKQEKKGFLNCETKQEIIDLYGYGEIDEDTYYRGLDYFDSLNKPPEISIVEKYRAKLKELINREKGTIKELNEELNPVEKQQEENAFDRFDRLQREERNKALQLSDALEG